MKLVTNYGLELMGLKFYHYDGLQQEMRAGIINEHECTFYSTVACILLSKMIIQIGHIHISKIIHSIQKYLISVENSSLFSL